MRSMVVSVILTVSMIFGPTVVQAKPAPPAELLELLEEFSEVEESLEALEWDEAMEAVRSAGAELEEMAEEISSAVGEEDLEKIRKNLKALENFIEAEAGEKAEGAYIALQKSFFELSDAFAYETEPVLLIMKKYIGDEALEAAEKGDLDEVKSEMKEVGAFYKMARELLLEKGKPAEKVDRLGGMIKQVIGACNDGDKKKAVALLQETKTLFEELL